MKKKKRIHRFNKLIKMWFNNIYFIPPTASTISGGSTESRPRSFTFSGLEHSFKVKVFTFSGIETK